MTDDEATRLGDGRGEEMTDDEATQRGDGNKATRRRKAKRRLGEGTATRRRKAKRQPGDEATHCHGSCKRIMVVVMPFCGILHLSILEMKCKILTFFFNSMHK